jgi:hypothetical protein
MRHLALIILLSLASPTLAAAPLSLGGRMVETNGKPVAGPVDLRIKFYRDATTPTAIGVTVPDETGVPLVNGVYQLTLTIGDADLHTLFDGTDVWVAVTDLTHSKTYARQQFMYVPYALKVPVDGTTITYDGNGKLRALTGGGGNMNSGTYDLNTNNKADGADDADRLGGALPAAYMLEADYDTNGDGKVNSAVTADTATNATNATNAGTATNATQLDGQAASYYRNATNINAGTLDEARIDADITRDSELPTPAAIATGFAANAVSGDKIDGGTISNFASVGIDDNADSLALTIDSGENVGIGTTTPSSNVTIQGVNNINFGANFANGVAALRIQDGTTASLLFDSNQIEQKDSSALLHINYNSPSVTTINVGGGNVGIGTTAPESNLHVASDAATHFYLDRSDNLAAGPTVALRKSRGTGAAPTPPLSNDFLGNFTQTDLLACA